MTQQMELMDAVEPCDEHGSHHETSSERNLLSENTDMRLAENSIFWRSLETFHAYFYSFEALELCFCTAIFVSGLLLELLSIPPRQRAIPFQQLKSSGEYIVNQEYDKEFQGDTISDAALMIYGVALPFLSQMILCHCCSGNFSRRRTLCVYLTAIGVTLLLTDAIKTYAGYLRPIFYDVCVPDEYYQTCTSEEVDDARKSFPSGHASTSFCCLGLLSFHLEDQFGVSKLRFQTPTTVAMNSERSQSHQRTVVVARVASILSKSPLLLAVYIAASRVVDNKHFPADIVGGSVIGLSVALWIHGIWDESRI